MPALRHIVMGLALVLTVAASVLDWPWQQEQDSGSTASDRAAQRKPSATTAAEPRPSASDVATHAQTPTSAGERLQHSKANPFAVHSWLPPVVRVKAPPPPPPRAPPLPFAYIGKMQDGAAVTAFVSQGGRNHVLHSGDTLSGYRVESITPTDMTFVYLPLNEKQRLTFRSEN